MTGVQTCALPIYLQQAIEDVLWPLLSAGDMGTMDPVVERQQMDEVESHVATLHTSMEIYVSGRWFGPSVEIQNKNYDNLRKVVRLAVLYEYGPDVTVSINSIRLVYTPSLSVVDED